MERVEQTEPLWKRLNAIHKQKLNENVKSQTGMSYEEYEEYQRKQLMQSPDYVPIYKEHGFETLEEYLKSKPSQQYPLEDLHKEDWVTGGVSNTMKEANRLDTVYFSDDLEKGYDY